MKYPECVYKIGNEFEQNDKHRMKLGELHEGDKEWTFFDQHVSFRGYHEYWAQRHLESATLVSITVETLAELARENGHSIDFSFYPKETFPEDVVIRVPNMNGGDTHFATRAKDEPLGEFFLRVAKERNYIK